MRALDRFGALSGAASIVAVIVGSDVLGTPPGNQPVHPSDQRDLDNVEWLADNGSAQIGVSLELLGFAFLVVFVGYAAARLRPAGWLATVALAGGLVEVAIKLASGAPTFTAYLLRDEITPATARVLVDMNSAAFVLSWLPMGIFVAGAAGAGLLTHDLGRLLGWGGVAFGTATVTATVVAGVHVLSAIFVPFVLCMLWILVVSSLWGFAGILHPRADRPVEPLASTL